MAVIITAFTFSPVAVVVVGVVTSQSSETAQADGVREEDLGSCIHPYLKCTIHIDMGAKYKLKQPTAARTSL